jgi:hypothetical protein
MKTFLITEDEKNRILNMHKRSSANHYLMEQPSTPDEYKDLIGKTVKFTFNRMDKVMSTASPNDVWYKEELLKELDTDDKEIYNDIIKKPIIGRIKEVKGLDLGGDTYVLITLNNLNTELGFGTFGLKNDEVTYFCGKGVFDMDIDVRQGTFFKDKIVRSFYSCETLSNFLEKKLPCGNFDFSMKGTDTLPGTLS